MSVPFGFRTARIAIEEALRDQILLALGRRLQPAQTLAALAADPSSALADDDLRFVIEAAFTYRWRRAETAPPDGALVVAPTDLAPGKPGRWMRTTSTVATGYLDRCELYNEDIDEGTMQERLFSKKPAVLLTFDGARHKPVSNRAGALYWYIASYSLLVISTNMRGGAAAFHGSPRAAEAMPGTAAMLGDLKAILAGSNLGIDDVERVEIGDERPVIVALAKRTVVEQLTITIWSSIRNEDSDLVPLGELELQRQLVDDRGDAVDYGPADEIDPSSP
jgi:hypothetical protein